MLPGFVKEPSGMEIRPIKTTEDYQAALEEIERLFDAAPDTPEGDRLEVLVTLVEAYERRHHGIPLPDPIEAIEYHMESRGLSRRDLEPHIGSRARVSEILNRRRPLTLRMIRNLEDGLGIPAEILIQRCELAVSKEEKAIGGYRAYGGTLRATDR
jgi:HTH-type transcriptional regulator/antitoxin HigA